MNNEDLRFIYSYELSKYIGDQNSKVLYDKLQCLSDNEFRNFISYVELSNDLRSPIIAWLLNLFFGYSGIARFYVGDNNRATIYLIFFIASFIIFGFLIIVPFIAMIIDIFKIIQYTKDKNLYFILLFLQNSRR